MGHRRRGAAVGGREPLSPRTQPDEGVRRARFEGRRRGPRPHAHRGLRLRRRHRPGRDRRRAGRTRHDELSPDAGNRTRSGQDLCGQRNPRDAFRRRVHPPQSLRLRVGARRDAAEAEGGGPEGIPARGGSVSRGLAEVVPDRPRRSEPRPVVAAARFGRLPRRGPHAPVRYADLREIRQRGRRHHRLRSKAPPQHLDLSLEAEDREPRALLQRRRARRLRHPRLRHRRRHHPGPAMARRPRPPAPQSAGSRARQPHDAPRRIAGRPVDRQLRARPPVRRAGEEPEHDRRQSADDAAAGRRADADRHLRGPARAADTGSRNAGADAGTRSGRIGVHRRGAELSVQQSQLLVSAGAGQRLRDGDHSHIGPDDARLRGQRRAGARIPDNRGQRRTRRAAD